MKKARDNLYKGDFMNKLVSIIVTAFNVEKYLARCLDSILNQSYKEIEIILINDGSCDNTHSICLIYEEKDIRVRYFDNKKIVVLVVREILL